MDKKDIYEHLAKIYLDASSKKKKKSKDYAQVFKNLFLVSIICVLGLSLSLAFGFKKGKSVDSETALVMLADAAKINFDFDPAKKEIFTINLNNLSLSRFKALGFAVKRANYQDKISLRVEFTTSFREKSEVYVRDIPHTWQDYKINFSSFNSISDWSEIKALSFAVEEWNTKEKKGIVYLDNVRLLK